MITKIDDDGRVIIKPHGKMPGTYYVSEFTAEELVTEREKIQGYLLYARKIAPTAEESLEIKRLEKLVEQLSCIITNKCEIKNMIQEMIITEGK